MEYMALSNTTTRLYNSIRNAKHNFSKIIILPVVRIAFDYQNFGHEGLYTQQRRNLMVNKL